MYTVRFNTVVFLSRQTYSKDSIDVRHYVIAYALDHPSIRKKTRFFGGLVNETVITNLIDSFLICFQSEEHRSVIIPKIYQRANC